MNRMGIIQRVSTDSIHNHGAASGARCNDAPSQTDADFYSYDIMI